ncbi:hypothetical protein Taro_024169 [Colocasia esculenta]|uniref:RING-type domain-containing protein n=1 Tax=Colocasia esculenta TaxID=4460 RepID=A0A843VCX9_COLES|nr:hypothetical protein [Colocasia esculenta]
MELAKISPWQKCPNCGVMVERIDGCIFIRCRCQHCFCYRCASAMNVEDQRHFCATCGLTWDN